MADPRAAGDPTGHPVDRIERLIADHRARNGTQAQSDGLVSRCFHADGGRDRPSANHEEDLS